MSAAFHMAQRTGVILSGDYSGAPLPLEGAFGITRTGIIWKNKDVAGPLEEARYEVRYPKDNWTAVKKVSRDKIRQFEEDHVATSGDLKTAVAYITERLKKEKAGSSPTSSSTPSGVSGGLKVPKGTYNDGSYTYEIRSATEAYVAETGVTFKSPDEPTEPRWQKFVSDLNAAYADKRLKEGKATPRSSGGGGSSYVPAPVVSPAVVAPVATPFYKAKWFLPAVGVATLGVVLLIALWPSKKKDAAPVVYLPAPPPVPVPAPAPQAV
jgi:hypothetical protein